MGEGGRDSGDFETNKWITYVNARLKKRYLKDMSGR